MNKVFYTVLHKTYLDNPDWWFRTGKKRPLLFKRKETAENYRNQNSVVCEVIIKVADSGQD